MAHQLKKEGKFNYLEIGEGTHDYLTWTHGRSE
ncbi:MAG: Uncharacterised protein [Flavobacteriaceae bacterium]|nr:MAG: Uncharacterised protein [Flavobacteriaceae bacterium]